MMSFQISVISENFRRSEADRRRPQGMRRSAEQHGSQPDSLAPQLPPELQVKIARFKLDVNRSRIAAANSAGVLRINASRPSSSPSPAQPIGVVTTARAQAIASITLILVPADTSRGTATTAACA